MKTRNRKPQYVSLHPKKHVQHILLQNFTNSETQRCAHTGLAKHRGAHLLTQRNTEGRTYWPSEAAQETRLCCFTRIIQNAKNVYEERERHCNRMQKETVLSLKRVLAERTVKTSVCSSVFQSVRLRCLVPCSGVQSASYIGCPILFCQIPRMFLVSSDMKVKVPVFMP